MWILPDPADRLHLGPHRIDAAAVLDFVCNHIARLPGGADRLSTSPAGFKRSRPCTIVLDNASIHHADAFKGRREELAAIGVHLFCLPSRSLELNCMERIERIWRSVKYQDMPVRAYTTAKELHTARRPCPEQAGCGDDASHSPNTQDRLARWVRWGPCGKGPGNGHLAARPTQWAASRCFHAPADADAEDWIAVKTARILRGYAQQAADEIRAEADHCKLTGD